MDYRHELEGNLRKLRLPGVLFNMATRIREAEENDLAYGEFAALLFQDEIIQRENNNYRKRITMARFGMEKTFEGFDFKFNEKGFLPKLLRELAGCAYLDLRKNIIIAGPPGIGKTHIAKSLGHEACRRGNTVLFKKAAQLLEELIQERDLGKDTLFRKCLKCELFILDDFGLKKAGSDETEIFYRIIDERLGNGSTILTSNRPPEDWLGIFPDPVIGGAILDRLMSGSIKLMVKGDARSFRKEGNGLTA